MEFLRIAGATLNQTPLDIAGNTKRILAAMKLAQSEGVRLLCLPELSLSGYGCEDAFFSSELARGCEKAVHTLLDMSVGMTLIVGFPCIVNGALYNCAGVIQDGKILGIHPKKMLAREGVHYEPRWFRPWEFGRWEEISFCGGKVPFGDYIYQLGSVGLAVEICEEAWTSIPGAAYASNHVQLVVNPSASHFALGKYQTRENLVANSSRAMHATYLYTNLLGCEAGRLIYDGGVLIAEKGHIVSRGPRFGFFDGYMTTYDCYPEGATIDKLKHQSVSHEYQRAQQRGRAHDNDGIRKIEAKDPRSFSMHKTPPSAAAMSADELKDFHVAKGNEHFASNTVRSRQWEFLQAEILGLFDYLRKSRHQGFVVSLSGGVDSSCCAVLVAHMIAEALRQLGAQEFARRLGLDASRELLEQDDLRGWVRRLLLCVYQKTAQSGPVTENAARELSEELGCEFHVCDVESIVQSYVELAQKALGIQLTWNLHDLPLQNIQARVRAPLPWLFANLRRSLLLTTSNRSEAAVGYATMDGDTAGGLAPLAGIDKPFLREWLKWAENSHEAQLLPWGPIKALGHVNIQNPTAELRPQGVLARPQTDEDDLMPYPVLERIERYFIRDRLGPEDIKQLVRRDFPAYNHQTLNEWVDRFMQLWAKSQWKRERFAPSFHLDEVSLDPKSYCRYPILS